MSKKYENLHIRIESELDKAIKEQALAAHLTKAAWVRQTLWRALEKDQNTVQNTAQKTHNAL